MSSAISLGRVERLKFILELSTNQFSLQVDIQCSAKFTQLFKLISLQLFHFSGLLRPLLMLQVRNSLILLLHPHSLNVHFRLESLLILRSFLELELKSLVFLYFSLQVQF